MIPTLEENPTGFHAKYRLEKTDGSDFDPDSEYFVLRLDEGGDPEHVKACRAAILTYADNIESFIPKLAKDLRERYG